jgi:hypothetical protein
MWTSEGMSEVKQTEKTSVNAVAIMNHSGISVPQPTLKRVVNKASTAVVTL